MQPEVLASIIGPLLTAVLAGSAVVLRAWQARRTRQDEAEESLDRRRQQITFIDTWLTAHHKVSGYDPQLRLHTERAVADLEFLYQQMTLELHHPPVRRRRFTAADALRLVLLIPVSGAGAKALRVFYYILSIGGILFIIATMASLEPSPEGLGYDIGVAMFLTLIWAAPAVIFAALTQSADRAGRNARARRAGPPEPSPTWPMTPAPPISGYPAQYTPTGPLPPPGPTG